MGFTERASCRPYKNCYKSKMKGGRKRKTPRTKSASKSKTPRSSKRKTMKSSKKESGNISPAKEHVNTPAFVYHSEHTSYTSHPNNNTPYGKRTVVNIQNGVVEKRLEILDKSGKAIKVNKQKLNADEVCELKQGNYVPGLWVALGV